MIIQTQASRGDGRLLLLLLHVLLLRPLLLLIMLSVQDAAGFMTNNNFNAQQQMEVSVLRSRYDARAASQRKITAISSFMWL